MERRPTILVVNSKDLKPLLKNGPRHEPVFLFYVSLAYANVAMSLIRKIPPVLRNVYVLVALGYLVWMLFLDANNIPNQFKTSAKLSRLEADKQHFEQKIEEVKKDREELLGDPDLLEKFAREKYLMRKPAEVVYVIEREDE